MDLLTVLQTNDTETINGMSAHSTTLDACLDFFSRVGSMRNSDKQDIINLFIKAFDQNPLLAMKTLFWVRDIRGGAGERNTFRILIDYLADNRTEALSKNLHLIPFYGRWDDLLMLVDTKLNNEALDLIKFALYSDDKLAAKWMPRPNATNKSMKHLASVLRKHLGLTPKQYRKLLVENTDVVETKMCQKLWDEIDYSKLPSKALSDYGRAFNKHSSERYRAYLESVQVGDVKMNTGAVYPYNVVNAVRHGDANSANTMWDNLPDYMEGSTENVLPVVDTSGSMSCSAGGSKSVSCMDVAISLGIYISERNSGQFKDSFITFSSQPKLQVLKGSLKERVGQLTRASWEMNTNIQAVFDTILTAAVKNKVPQEDMPTTVLILSDMQFDKATNGGWGRKSDYNPNVQQLIVDKYNSAGYTVPKVVYWNLHDYGNSPVQFHETGTALVSGFSPSLLKTVLKGDVIDPIKMMLDVVDVDRYGVVTI